MFVELQDKLALLRTSRSSPKTAAKPVGKALRNQLAEKRWWIQSENCIGHRAKCLGHFVVRFTVYFGQHPPIQ